MPDDNLAEREHQPLCGWVLRRIGWRLYNVHVLEMHPQWVRRVAQPTVGKGIGCEQITKFVMVQRLRHAPNQ
jgi:hypothetical protein